MKEISSYFKIKSLTKHVYNPISKMFQLFNDVKNNFPDVVFINVLEQSDT